MDEKEKKLNQIIKNELKNYPAIIERNFCKFSEYNKDESVIRIMQWNMLARALCIREPSSKTPPEAYEWNYKKWRTIEELIRSKADIICVQEADFYEDIKPHLHELGYTSVFCPKFSSPCLDIEPNYGPDGCAIFYRLSMFQINNISCEKIVVENNIHSQVFIILQLKHKQSDKLLTIVCLHLKSKEANFKKREIQSEYILKALKLHLNGGSINLKTHPIFLCGDFNGEPFEKFYDNITNDQEITKLVDAYTIANNGNKQPTTIKERNLRMIKRGIDYVFYNKEAIEFLGYLELPKNNQLLDEQGLPNLEFSSDHLSLLCDFKLK